MDYISDPTPHRETMKTAETPTECSGCAEPIPQCTCGHPRVVVCAANRSSVTGRIIAGARHWDSVMRQQVDWDIVDGKKRMPKEWVGCDQGFIDQRGIFMNRQEAYAVAEAAGQIKYEPETKPTLFSENLY